MTAEDQRGADYTLKRQSGRKFAQHLVDMHSPPEPPAEPEAEPEHEQEAEQQPLVDEVHEIDDRVSVHEVDAAPAAEAPAETAAAAAHDDAIESVQGKTIAQLREMLTAKGIPFNKSDKKPTLISLVQISA